MLSNKLLIQIDLSYINFKSSCSSGRPENRQMQKGLGINVKILKINLKVFYQL